ncbi:toluene tolerance protein [Pseudomonas sp. JZ134]|uniref:toluene tolerance protein n=1 Tax=Pseudomonas sp. JZ134 TaxID=2806615 RepID=UPI003DA061A6
MTNSHIGKKEMRSISAQDLEVWVKNGKILERDTRGPKVIALSSGLFLKVFHVRKKTILTNLYPPAISFFQNTQRLIALGLAAPNVTDVFWTDRATGTSACLYEPLPGESLETIFKRCPEEINRNLYSIAAFILELHQKGIYFRSLHLGNIIQTNEKCFGLIDVLDLKFKSGPLKSRHIRRNFNHLTNYLERRNLNSFPIEILLQTYKDLKKTE